MINTNVISPIPIPPGETGKALKNRDTKFEKKMWFKSILNPNILLKSEYEMFQEATKYVQTLKDIPYIFNLGHGLLPETDPDKVDKLVKFYRNF